MSRSYAIGVDLGGTKLEIALIDKQGRSFHAIKMPTHVTGGPKEIENDIVHTIDKLTEMAEGEIFGVGIGVPGQIEAETGIVRFAPNLKWENVPLKQNLMKRLKIPVAITNDVRAAAIGEWIYGAGEGSQDLVCLFVGTGIGSGIIASGRILQGYNNSAGELGHMIIQMEGPICTCGSKGCLEALASGWALAKKTRELIQKNPRAGVSLLERADGNIENVTTKMIVEAYHEKDFLAEEIIVGMFHALTVGCINIANAFNPERLILGGGVLSGLPEAIEHVKEGIKKYALKSASSKLSVLTAKFTKDAGSIGAGALAWKTIFKE